jgi:hypothetical protein
MSDLDIIAQKYEAPIDEVKKEYEVEVQTLMSTLNLSREVAEKHAIDIVRAAFRGRKVKKLSVFEGIIFGSSGRITDWAEINKKKVADKMKGKSIEQCVTEGLTNEMGEMLFDPADQYRAGKVIPKSDFTQEFYGVFADGNKQYFTVVEVKARDVAKTLKSGQLIVAEATKMQKSSDKMLGIRVREPPKIKKDVDRKKLVEYITKFVPNSGVGFITVKDNINKPVCLLNHVVRSVRYDMGDNKSTIVELDPGTDDSIDTISLWLAPKDQIGTLIQRGLPINVCGTVGQTSDRQVSVNGFFVWYDEAFEPKSRPTTLAEVDAKPKVNW